MLYEMRASINQLLEKFQNISRFDYYVVDENLLRITGTGMYAKYVGFNLPLGSETSYVIETKKALVKDDTYDGCRCKTCPITTCLHELMIIYPIVLDGKVVGAVAIGAFSDETKQELILNKDILCKEMEIATDVIAARVYEKKYSKWLEVITNTINEGIVLTNNQGEVIFHNNQIQEYFSLGNKEIKHIKDLIPDYDVNKLLCNNASIGGKYNLCMVYVDRKIFLSIRLIDTNSIKSEILFVFKSEKDFGIMESVSALECYTSFDSLNKIKGTSNQISKVKNLAINASRHDSTVLLRGESGTGKGLLARSIHQMSVRNKFPFIAVNCAAIPETLMESELFGYEAGAFTGAGKSGKPGKFEMANNGTLFLDEIGDMAFHLQPKMLRALESGEVERVGGTETKKLNIRIIAATNRNLEEMIDQGKFRKDLYYRLNVIPLYIPSLRERREDILLLSRYFLDKYNKKYSKLVNDFSIEATKMLLLYDWPGNIRELENVIEYAIHEEETAEIQLLSLPIKTKACVLNVDEAKPIRSVSHFENSTIQELLKKYKDIPRKYKIIADELGISLSTLYRKIKKIQNISE